MAGSSGGIRAGKTFVEAYLDDSRLQKGLKQAEARLKSFGASITALGAGFAALGAAITAPLLGAAKTFADVGSELNDMSARTGLSVENLSELGHAATQTGTDLEAVETGVRKMQKALVAAATGSEESQVAFMSLGLSVRALMRMKPDQQFEAVAAAIARVRNPTAKAAAAMSILGKSGTALIPLIDDYDALAKEARDLGLVMSTEDAEAADTLGDALDIVSKMAKRTAVVIGSALAPMLTDLAGGFAAASKKAIDWVAANKPLIVTAFQVGAGITAVGLSLVGLGVAVSGVGAVLGGVAAGLSTLAAVVGAVLSPVGLVVAGLAAAGYAFVTYTETGKAALTSLGETFAGIKADATTTFKGIADALKAGDIALAGKILWLGLRVEFQKGVNALSAVWAEWGVGTVQAFADVSADISRLMIDLSSGIEAIWVKLTHAMTGTWGDMIAGLLKNLSPLVAALDAVGLDGAGLVDKAVAGVGLQQSDPAALQNDLAAVGQDNAQKRQAVTDQQAADATARRDGAAGAVAGGDAELAKLMAELEAAVGQAGKEARDATALKGVKPAIDAQPTPDQLDQGMQDAAKRTVDVSGSFSAAALSGMGSGTTVADAVEENKKATEKAVKELQKLNEKARAGKLVFTS